MQQTHVLEAMQDSEIVPQLLIRGLWIGGECGIVKENAAGNVKGGYGDAVGCGSLTNGKINGEAGWQEAGSLDGFCAKLLPPEAPPLNRRHKRRRTFRPQPTTTPVSAKRADSDTDLIHLDALPHCLSTS